VVVPYWNQTVAFSNIPQRVICPFKVADVCVILLALKVFILIGEEQAKIKTGAIIPVKNKIAKIDFFIVEFFVLFCVCI